MYNLNLPTSTAHQRTNDIYERINVGRSEDIANACLILIRSDMIYGRWRIKKKKKSLTKCEWQIGKTLLTTPPLTTLLDKINV